MIGTFALFVWGHWRYDVVALIALLTAVLFGVVPYASAFSGFSSPAVITVVCIMVITQAINESGVVDLFVKRLTPITSNVYLHVASLTILAACLSAFMNNVGALALLMPVAIQTARLSKRALSVVLMPVAFGSVLGGLTTAIGTPPNIIIASYRESLTGHAFTMFQFSKVGLPVAVVGIVFIIFFGWRLLPKRKAPKQTDDLFRVQDYIAEVKVVLESAVVEKTISEVEKLINNECLVIGLIRNNRKRFVIKGSEILQINDILIIEASPKDLEKLIKAGRFELLVGGLSPSSLKTEDNLLMELVIPQGSTLEGSSSQSIRMRTRFHVNLLALARQGSSTRKRLPDVKFKVGDVLLMQGEPDDLQEFIAKFGLLPLVERGLSIGVKRKALLPLIIFIFGIGLSAFNVFPAQISFSLSMVLLVIFNIIPTRRLYTSIDWSIIVLLGAMIPLGSALESSGAADVIANSAVVLAHYASPIIILALILVITMTISDIMNNVATAAVMAPIAVATAKALFVSIDPFLIAVAIGASCSFLTPIAHQNNTLVMGPGGYRFYDFTIMGLPLEILVLLVSLPTILFFWPL